MTTDAIYENEGFQRNQTSVLVPRHNNNNNNSLHPEPDPTTHRNDDSGHRDDNNGGENGQVNNNRGIDNRRPDEEEVYVNQMQVTSSSSQVPQHSNGEADPRVPITGTIVHSSNQSESSISSSISSSIHTTNSLNNKNIVNENMVVSRINNILKSENTATPPHVPDSPHVNQQQSEPQHQLPQLLHWSEVMYECTDVPIEEWTIVGGSDYGQMPYFLDTGDILLELDGVQLAGLTRTDVMDIVQSKELHHLKAVSNTSSFGLPVDLREYLSRRFVRGSIDHELQATIRDNVYMRTIPCTTRPPRPGELDNVDYKFVTRDEFLVMERSGVLLESGIFSGHYYGTPLPMSTPATPVPNPGEPMSARAYQRTHSAGSQVSDPKSPGSTSGQTSLAAKRRRNRSNIAAIDAASLPHGWEKISDTHYGVYYIDHINKRTQYERPYELELTKGCNGFGFTLIELDRGLIVVKNVIPGGPAFSSGVIAAGDVLVSLSGVSVSGLQHSDIARLFSTFSVGDRVKLTFARGYQLPPELLLDDQEYEFLTLSIEKGTNGFGFTIADSNSGQKVKKILDEDRCAGNLRQGDILCTVNNLDLSPLTHNQVVDVLKDCSVGETANMTIKRKKRFRSKTPVIFNQQSSLTGNQMPSRNCKTPSCEMMMRRDNDWLTNATAATTVTTPGSDQTSTDRRSDDQHQQQQFIPSSKSAPQLMPPPPLMPASAQHMISTPEPPPPIPPSHQPVITTQPQVVAPGNFFEPISNPSDEEYEYYRTELKRSESGFGFRIIGGAEEGRNVTVGSLVIGGVAHRDEILKSGDEIISINEIEVTGATHHYVVQLMSQCGESVSLLVRRRKDSESFEVMLSREENEGFGFVLISCGMMCLIGRIIDNSPCQRNGRIRVRDKILAVNDQDITGWPHSDIVTMIKESGRTLKLKIMPADCYVVELMRGPRGFGFSIRGGAEFNGMPLFILRIAPDGPAYTSINVGDEIVEINGLSTVGMTHTDAVNIISRSGQQVKLKLRKNTPANNNNVSNNNNSPDAVTPSLHSMPHLMSQNTYGNMEVVNGMNGNPHLVSYPMSVVLNGVNGHNNNHLMHHPPSTHPNHQQLQYQTYVNGGGMSHYPYSAPALNPPAPTVAGHGYDVRNHHSVSFYP